MYIKDFCAAQGYYIFKYLYLILLRIQKFSLNFFLSSYLIYKSGAFIGSTEIKKFDKWFKNLRPESKDSTLN